MKISAKIERCFDLQTGQGKNGQWSRKDYLATYSSGAYLKSFVFSVYGGKIESLQEALFVGNQCELSLDIESREYNGKYYTNVSCWDAVVVRGLPNHSATPADDTPPQSLIDEIRRDAAARNAQAADDLPF